MPMKLKASLFLLVVNIFSVKGQNIDSIATKSLQEVVVTGQFEPQSLKKSIHNVRVITAADIKNLGAVNLGDVLNQYVNITVTPNSNSGRSTVSMFGLDAAYFKVLVDNVPLVNENGLGNNTDLSQINLNDIERVEIIEGSMGVTHGANAVSGILNIITKKNSKNDWEISLTAQEETIGTEFELSDKGRHIQALKVSHNIDNHWHASVGVNRNDFKGFMGDYNGKFYTINDGTRGYKWLPKEQLQSNVLMAYKRNNFRMFYKFEWLNETIDFYGSAAHSGFNSQLGSYKYGDDERYFTNRLYHHMNGVGKMFSKINYNISISHQKQKREIETFRYNITHDIESNNLKQKDQSMEVLYSIGTFSNFFEDRNYDIQLGYEIATNKGFSVVDEIGSTTRKVTENINNYDLFAVSEIKLNEKFSFRPGARYSFQSMFDNQYAYSLGGRYLLNNGIESRLSVGKSFRTPDFYELFSKLIFDGHYFVGNENLIPEKSTTYEASLKKQTLLATNTVVSNSVMVSFNEVKDRITSALTGFEGATPKYEYINISRYKSINIATANQLKKDNWNFNLGTSFTWVSQLIDNQEFTTDNRFLFNFNINSSLAYQVPKWNTHFSVYYKLTGKVQQWEVGTNNYVLSNVDSYSWLDASIRKDFLNHKIEAVLGARNILNVTDVNRTRMNEGAAHATTSQLLLAYGRSYFLKLTYNLNF